MTPILRFERLTPTAKIPVRATPGSAGLDLYADEDLVMLSGGQYVVSTGLRMRLPDGYEGQIRARSSLARAGIIVANGPGTIDTDYRGELKVLLINLGRNDLRYNVSRGDRIAQLVVQRVEQLIIEEAPVHPADTARGTGGFGSTGR